ncbi:unnamed protein product [Dibothriocephalus latus]|uniref:G-protein coupled receptors family 1 profile domain-containing protein n=1 Tax=Dibothriocephalus latus TaxID=60516 RepID=A0A3P7LNH7_DIBLA|nr:unnamed protein product [Dibothriocephalus latus]
MQCVFGFASLNTAVRLSVDRYLIIVLPFKSRMSHRRALLMIAVAWCWSLIWSSPPFYDFGRYIPDGLQTSCSFYYLTRNVNNCIHIAGMLIFELLIPVGTIFILFIVWGPYSVLAFLSLNGYRSSLTSLSVEVAMLFSKFHSVCNPAVYAFMNARFRIRLVKIMSCQIQLWRAGCSCLIPPSYT